MTERELNALDRNSGIYAGIVVTVVLVLLADWMLSALQRRSLRWRPVDAQTLLH